MNKNLFVTKMSFFEKVLTSNIINKITGEKVLFILLNALFLLSFYYGSEVSFKNNLIHKILNVTMLTILIHFIFSRYVHKIAVISTDEKIAICFSISAIFSSLINFNFHSANFIVPLKFIITYIGISSYLKISTIDKKFLKYFLNFFLFLAIGHLLISVISNTNLFVKYIQNGTSINKFVWDSFAFSGVFENPNNFGNTMMIGVCTSFSLILYNYNKKNNFYFFSIYSLLLIFSIFGVLLSNARASMLGCSIYIFLTIIFIFKLKKTRNPNIKFLVLISIIISLCTYFLFNSSITNDMMKKFNRGTLVRIDYWLLFIKNLFTNISFKKIFFGAGYKGIIFPNSGEFSVTLHSILFTTLAKYGIIGVSLVSSLYIYLFKKNYKINALWFLIFMPLGFITRDLFDDQLIAFSLTMVCIFFTFVILLPIYYKSEG